MTPNIPTARQEKEASRTRARYSRRSGDCSLERIVLGFVVVTTDVYRTRIAPVGARRSRTDSVQRGGRITRRPPDGEGNGATDLRQASDLRRGRTLCRRVGFAGDLIPAPRQGHGNAEHQPRRRSMSLKIPHTPSCADAPPAPPASGFGEPRLKRVAPTGLSSGAACSAETRGRRGAKSKGPRGVRQTARYISCFSGLPRPAPPARTNLEAPAVAAGPQAGCAARAGPARACRATGSPLPARVAVAPAPPRKASSWAPPSPRPPRVRPRDGRLAPVVAVELPEARACLRRDERRSRCVLRLPKGVWKDEKETLRLLLSATSGSQSQ